MITFVNNLDPDQDLDSNSLIFWYCVCEVFKKSVDNKIPCKQNRENKGHETMVHTSHIPMA